MDAITAGGGQSPALAVSAAREALQDRIAELRKAMAEFGVRPGHPEAALFGAMMSTQLAFAEMAVEMGQSVDGTIAAAREVNETEVERLREATALADLTIRQARAAAVAAEVEQQRALGKVVESIAPKLAATLRDTVVLKEWRYNKRLNLLHHMKVGGLVLLVIAGGYALRSWETWGTTSALQRCLANVERNAAGRAYCPLDVMVAPEAPQAAG